MYAALGKGDGKWGGGGESVTIRGKKRQGEKKRHGGGGKEGREMRGSQNLKRNVISAAAKRKQCLLLGEACLAACSICLFSFYFEKKNK